MRLDHYLVKKHFFKSRTQAQEAIKKGVVFVFINNSWQTQKKPSFICDEETRVKFDDSEFHWVSRAGLKLERALNHLKLNLKDQIALDIGQSTGGFTEVLLSHGVSKVFGIDVGKEQLVEKLRKDERVVFFENQDARDLQCIKDQKINFFSVDLSFISLLKVAPEIYSALKNEKTSGLFLVKPQFEVGRPFVGKGGLVKASNVHLQCEKSIIEGLEAIGFKVLDYFPSGLKGKDGNQEFFCFVST